MRAEIHVHNRNGRFKLAFTIFRLQEHRTGGAGERERVIHRGGGWVEPEQLASQVDRVETAFKTLGLPVTTEPLTNL